MDHRSLQQLAAADALEDAGPLERLAFSVHRRTCSSCRALRDDLERVTYELALLAPTRRPPAALESAVMAAIRVGAPGPLTAQLGQVERASPASARDLRRWKLLSGAATGVAVGLAVVVVGLGITALRLEQDLGRSVAALELADHRLTAQAAAVTLALDPGHVSVTLHSEPMATGAHAYVVYRPGSSDGYLLATDLPPTPPGRVYQLWFADAAGVHALATFSHDGHGAFVAPFGVPLDAATAAMITLEPTGGAAGEPGPEVVFGEL